MYLLEKRVAASDSGDAVLLIYLGAESTYLERAARHMAQVLQNLSPRPDAVVDVAVYDVAQARPEFLDKLDAVPVFEQSS